jgi:hypothetical protein
MIQAVAPECSLFRHWDRHIMNQCISAYPHPECFVSSLVINIVYKNFIALYL